MVTDELFQGCETICSTLTRLWGRVGISSTTDSIGMLGRKLLCSRYFSESDFTTAERVCLNRVAVPCGSDSAAESLPHPPYPSLHTPSFDPLPSVLTLEDDLHFPPPTRICCNTYSYP
jgi:hypothetical protein